MYSFVEGYQMIKHFVVPVLQPSLELAVHKSKLLLIVAGLRLHRHSNIEGVHEELVWRDKHWPCSARSLTICSLRTLHCVILAA